MRMVENYEFLELPEVHAERNLAELIVQGGLSLRGDALVRHNFAFVIDQQPIGVFAVQSTGPRKLSLVRAWNRSQTTRDPFSGLEVPCRGRQFWRAAALHEGRTFFLVEFSQLWQPTRRVAFRAHEARTYDCNVIEFSDLDLRCEALELGGVQVLG